MLFRSDWGVDLVSLSAHKIHGPVGIGALVVRKGVSLSPLLRGGSQEGGLRPGTLNAAGVVGFGAAVELCSTEEMKRIASLRDSLWLAIRQNFPNAILNGSIQNRAPHNLHVTFPGKVAADLASALDRKRVCVSTGSACRAGSRKPSHVLAALNPGEPARDGLRISLSRFTSEEEVQRFVEILRGQIGRAHV